MKARFNYLEKLPLRKFETAKNCIGCVIEEGSESVLIAELQDVNDSFTHDEILKRVSIDQAQRSKNLLVYLLKAGAT
jgi:hypothetical protein